MTAISNKEKEECDDTTVVFHLIKPPFLTVPGLEPSNKNLTAAQNLL